MKLFGTTVIQVVDECKAYFDFGLPSVHLVRAVLNFWTSMYVIW